jgi:putative flippase GtrA
MKRMLQKLLIAPFATMNGARRATVDQLLRFGGVGIFNTVLTFSTIVGMKVVLGASDLAANAAGYAVGLLVSFLLNRQWTFRAAAGDKDRVVSQIVRFLGIFFVAYAINIATVFSLIALGVNPYLAHAAGMPLYTLVFFLGCRRYVFHSDGLILGVSRHVSWPLMIVLVTSAIVLFHDLGAHPIELWDESRLANNAIEMAVSEFSLVTTFDWKPDHWNTKPPLLIWLMAASLRLFGFDEFGVRLPGAVAAFCTTIVLWAFIAYRLGRPVAGCLAVLLLLATPHYVHEHGARSGNYEPLLGLLTTGYLLAAYVYCREEVNRRRWLVVALFLAFLAFMTKTVQALLFFPSIAVFLIAACDRTRIKEVVGGMALLMLLVAAYYVARESADPGYIAASIHNDLLGRYATAIEEHHGNGWFYLYGEAVALLLQFGLLSSVILSFLARDETRAFSRYLFVAMAGYLIVISAAGTKLSWYVFPLFPLAAASSALLVAEGMSFVSLRLGRQATPHRYLTAMAMVLVCTVVVARNLETINDQSEWFPLKGACNKFILSKEAREASKLGLAVFHPGYNAGSYYAPTLFYTKILEAEGGTTIIVSSGGLIPSVFAYALSCSVNTVKRLEQSGRVLETIAGADNIVLLRMRESEVGNYRGSE